MASTAGRLFFGKMADLSCVNRIRMYQLGVFVIGICSFLVPLATGYVGLTAYAVTFGFFEACYVLLIPLVTNDIVGPHKMSYALGSAFTVMAFPMFLGPPIAGLYTFSYKKKSFLAAVSCRVSLPRSRFFPQKKGERYFPDMGCACVLSCREGNLFQPIRSASYSRETSGSVGEMSAAKTEAFSRLLNPNLFTYSFVVNSLE